MRNAEEFPSRRSGLARMRRTYRGPGPDASGRPGPDRIRYAHGGAQPRVEPLCTVPHGPGADPGREAWLTEFPAGRRHGDLWVLVCGGIAAAAAFAAAFLASGGVASHPATPATAVPAVVSQACPSPAGAASP
jgi:hypothetical protein